MLGNIPRLKGGFGQVFDRRKFLDGTIPTYWGPGQRTGVLDSSSLYPGLGLPDLFLLDPTGPYSPPTDWPKAGFPLGLPTTVRLLYYTGGGFAATGGIQPGGPTYQNYVAPALAAYQSAASGIEDALAGGVDGIYYGDSFQISADFVPFIDLPPGDIPDLVLCGQVVNVIISDGVSGNNIQATGNGGFIDAGDGPYDPSDPFGTEARFQADYPLFSLHRTIVLIDQQYANGILANAELFDAFLSNAANTLTFYTSETRAQIAATSANLAALCQRMAKFGFQAPVAISYGSISASSILAIVRNLLAAP